MAEEPQQVTKEPQGEATQAQKVQQEPQRETTKNPKIVEAGKRLAAHSCKKREERRKEQAQLENTGVNQYYGIGAVIALGVIGAWSWLLHLSNQERTSEPRSQGCFDAI